MAKKNSCALLSVSDKTGIVPLARILADAGVCLISTGGTAKALRSAGLEVVEVSNYTGFPEMLDGRLKTLHPKVHGGLLYLRDNPAHESALAAHRMESIDFVIVNLYPFEDTMNRLDASLAEAIENIDIGGPAMIRSAAKNYRNVTVAMELADYNLVGHEVQKYGETSFQARHFLAARAFSRLAAYDRVISFFLNRAYELQIREPQDMIGDLGDPRKNRQSPSAPSKEKSPIAERPLPDSLQISAPLVQTLRYGENPHQKAALYGCFPKRFSPIHGKKLSYNNVLDLNAAVALMREFAGDPPTLAILKHTNPCGVGQGESLKEAWDKALATDRQAAFGGIIIANAVMDAPCAKALSQIFCEVVAAPSFAPEALEILKKKNSLLVKTLCPETAEREQAMPDMQIRALGGMAYLAQFSDEDSEGGELNSLADLASGKTRWETVTKRAPSEAEFTAMKFGWRVVKHVKSNAVVYALPDRTLGVGAGQMSRVDSSRIAVWKAGEAKLPLAGSVVCSDAFFPFADGLITAAEAGATAAIQPGGSVRDAEVIAAANERGMAMILTHRRCFLH